MQGSSGGKKSSYLEIVRFMAKACEDFKVEGRWDDMEPIVIEPVKV